MDLQRLLGLLIGAGLRKRSMKSAVAHAATSREGLTLLAGIGFAVYEHFRRSQSDGADRPTGTATPPPFPWDKWSSAPPAPPPRPEPDLMLRAMAMAALADGDLDDRERQALDAHLDRVGATAAERAHLAGLLSDPGSIDDLAARVNDPGTAAEVWAAARLAIEPDTSEEDIFLAELAERLGLEDAVGEIEARLQEAGLI